jgi:predicted phage baseplate assembly protein
MNPSEFCQDDKRRDAVRARPDLNGLDYLEVSEDQLTLTVFFLGKAPAQLLKGASEDPAAYKERLKQSVRIDGGRRVRHINVVDVEIHQAIDPKTGRVDPDLDDSMRVQVDRYGDFTAYTLRIVGVENIDPFYDHLDFTFKAGCPSDLDCLPADVCPPTALSEPEINYLAKDYASFRQLLLDRLALIMPEWGERHVPDLGIALVEVLAYVGDYLSYYQDAVATEAYLDTARQRISVRRHARLVDYRMHEGCNARAWVCVETTSDLVGSNALDPHKVFFITGFNEALSVSGHVLTYENLRNVPPRQYEVFEPITREPIELYAAHNRICFYTWGNRECCLPKGATSATLKDSCAQAPPEPQKPSKQKGSHRRSAQQQPAQVPAPSAHAPERKLHLQVGDVLIFEEVIGPKTGNPADADPTHRHAVRLTRVEPGWDDLYGPAPAIVEIEWAVEDALPFPLCLSTIGSAPDCAYIEDISIARGNVVLVDHGCTEPPEDLGVVSCMATQAECDCEGHPSDITFVPGHYRPELAKTPLTHRVPFPQPSAVARQQARQLATIMPRVRDRLTALWWKARDGHLLATQELDELRAIFGSQAMNQAGPLMPDGRDWHLKNSAEQATAIQYLLAYRERWLGNKARRVAMLQARAQAGHVLNDAASEIAELFGAQYAQGLEPDSHATLGPAKLALLQDVREAVPDMKLSSVAAAPAPDCRHIRPLFLLADWKDPTPLASLLRDTSNIIAQVLRAQLSAATVQLIDVYDGSGAISETLRMALTNDLTQMLEEWSPQLDLLNSQSDDPHFVAEVDNDGRAQLRFGNGEQGRLPEAGSSFFATYRVGNGVSGNVGAEAISHLVLRDTTISGLAVQVRNPLPAVGGTDPESMAEVRLFAPTAFRKQLQRAVTADDYAQLVQRNFEDGVQRAAARLSWTGSWYEAQVAVDPLGSQEAGPPLLADIQQRLALYRRIGHDLAVLPARYVSLDIEMTVCVLPHYLRGHVEAELRDVFSTRLLPNGRRGFFQPDNLTFGEGVYLSRLVAVAQAVKGVESVKVIKLERLYEGDHGELAQGVLKLSALEVARLDNDPSFPEHGRLVFNMRGGR